MSKEKCVVEELVIFSFNIYVLSGSKEKIISIHFHEQTRYL